RVAPPVTTVTPAPSSRRARMTWAAGAATMIAASRGCRRKCRTVAARIASPPTLRNCLGVRRPRRAPTPPAGVSTGASPLGRLLTIQHRHLLPTRIGEVVHVQHADAARLGHALEL